MTEKQLLKEFDVSLVFSDLPVLQMAVVLSTPPNPTLLHINQSEIC